MPQPGEPLNGQRAREGSGMDFLLRPGMRLMRRLSMAGKFGLVSILLLVPMLTGMVTAYRTTTAEIETVMTERHGLQLVGPLTALVSELSVTRGLAEAGVEPATSWQGLLTKMDDATARYGDEFGLSSDWSALRTQVLRAHDANLTSAERASSAEQGARAAHQLLKAVADTSHLVLDPELDSRYLGTALVNRLPRIVIAAADLQSLQRSDTASTEGSDSMARQLALRDFNDAWRELALDLNTAIEATTDAPLRQELESAMVQMDSATAAVSALTLTERKEVAGEFVVFSQAATMLGETLTQATDELLSARQSQLSIQRAWPLTLTLLTILIVFYLMMALFRAIATDVNSVLSDISSVTSGEVHQNDPLSSADEFGQMSRAIIYARDRLTALVGALKYQATHDDLTALANRALFTEKVQESIEERQGPIVVLLVDLDGFKDLNDSFGHDFGDRLLRMVAARIHRNVPRRSVVARLGSDEFAILITDRAVSGEPTELVVKLAEVLAQPLIVEGRSVRMQAGIGYALAETRVDPAHPGESTTLHPSREASSVASAAPDTGPPMAAELPPARSALEMIRNADVALSYAKQVGKGHQVRFEPRMHDHTRNRTELSADLVGAIDRDEMFVVYQPLVDLNTNHLYGVEALLRWQHPVRGLVSPDIFVPIAEATGQITKIGKWVLERACVDLAMWRSEFPSAHHLTMEVNLATEQLTDPSLVNDVETTMTETGIDPELLVLEITESALVKDLEMALRRMAQLSELGVRIALDDFGTGYSSLSYLRRLPVTVMKIDKSFMRDDTAQGQALLRSIVDLGTGQGMQIVAEGVELAQQADQMRRAGCHIGQGHLWAPALQADQIRTVLAGGGLMGPALPALEPPPATEPPVPQPRTTSDRAQVKHST